jgi:hypothetical protein
LTCSWWHDIRQSKPIHPLRKCIGVIKITFFILNGKAEPCKN